MQQFELTTSVLFSVKNLGLEVQSKSVQIVAAQVAFLPSLPDFVFGEVFLQAYFVSLVLHIIEGSFMAEGFSSAQEWARKEPPYLGAAFGASFQRLIAYPLTDLEFILTQLAVSTVF